MTVYKRSQNATPEIIDESKAYRTDLLPGFELSLARLLAIVDEWRDAT
jgi:hypothetical protein